MLDKQLKYQNQIINNQENILQNDFIIQNNQKHPSIVNFYNNYEKYLNDNYVNLIKWLNKIPIEKSKKVNLRIKELNEEEIIRFKIHNSPLFTPLKKMPEEYLLHLISKFQNEIPNIRFKDFLVNELNKYFKNKPKIISVND